MDPEINLKKLRKEHQKLRKTDKRLRRKIKEITMGKTPKNTPEVANVVVKTELCEGRAIETHTELISTLTITTQVRLHADLVDVAAHMEVWTFHNKEVQTEDIPSCSIGTQIEDIHSCEHRHSNGHTSQRHSNAP